MQPQNKITFITTSTLLARCCKKVQQSTIFVNSVNNSHEKIDISNLEPTTSTQVLVLLSIYGKRG